MVHPETMDATELISLNKASKLGECSYDKIRKAVDSGDLTSYRQQGRQLVLRSDVIKWSTPTPVPVQTAAEG